jgi:hypothetical protein
MVKPCLPKPSFFGQYSLVEPAQNIQVAANDQPHPSSVELVLRLYGALVDTRAASPLALEAAVGAMAPATRVAITADLKCFLAWCGTRRPVEQAVPATPEALVHYLRWLAKGSANRAPAKPATLARRIASIARVHRILGFGEKQPLPTQAGMVRDTLKGLHREKRQRQRQAAPLRFGAAMAERQAAPEGVTVQALLASCGSDVVGLCDAALISVAYDAGLRVSELVGIEVPDLKQVADGSGRLDIAHSKTDQLGQRATAWLSPDTMGGCPRGCWLAESPKGRCSGGSTCWLPRPEATISKLYAILSG